VQNILNVEQIVDDNDKSITIAPRKGFQLLGLFHAIHSKEYNFPTLFFGHSRASLGFTYQIIIQAKLTSLYRKFTFHISNIYFKTIKILIHFILSYAWIHIRKNKIIGLSFNN
jgi:hypothetical protein